MSDVPQTPEAVAYSLLLRIADAEKWPDPLWLDIDRKKILDTYAECLKAVQAPGTRYNPSSS